MAGLGFSLKSYEDYTIPDGATVDTSTLGLKTAAESTPSGEGWSTDRRDDSVENRVTDLMKDDSKLMRQAETAGLQQANKRGLLNSSMAVGATQNEAYKAATPIAQQDASQAYGENLANMGISADFGLQENELKVAIAKQNAEITAKYGMQAEEIKAQYGLQENQLLSDKEMADLDAALQKELQQTDITAQKEMQETDISAKKEMQQTEIDAAVEQQNRAIEAEYGLQAAEIKARFGLQENELLSDMQLAELDIEARKEMQQTEIDYNLSKDELTKYIAELGNDTDQQSIMASYLVSQEQIYAAKVSDINNNKDLTAEQREEQLVAAKESFVGHMDAISSILGVDVTEFMLWPDDEETTTETTTDTSTGTDTSSTTSTEQVQETKGGSWRGRNS